MAARPERSARVGHPSSSWFDEATGELLSFDFDVDHGEELLVHHQQGGTGMAARALAQLRLAPAMRSALKRRILAIGPGYDAIHVRHTDYRSRYEAMLAQLRDAPPPRLFVATDNAQILREFRGALGEARVFSFSRLPDDGAPMHLARLSGEALFVRNRDSILDLLMLGLARTLYVVPLDGWPKMSGYSFLASVLRERPDTLRRLLSDRET